MGVFENFKLLKENMKKEGWIIDAFSFEYKNINYVIIVKLYLENEIKPQYALLKVEILKTDDSGNSLVLPVNSHGFMTDAKTLRQFFNIEYTENLGNIIQQFNLYFSGFIPTQVTPTKSDSITILMTKSLSKNDSEDSKKIYCFALKRNPNNGHRSLFNDNKTRLLRPNLYTKIKEEFTISFCYSQDMKDEKSDDEILLNFSKKA